MVHKARKETGKQIEWGFDLTDVISDDAFYNLLNRYGFVEVSTKPPQDWMKGRFSKGVTTFVNPKGIRMTVEHLGGRGNDKGALGYIGMKAPKNAESELKRFLVEFRGKKVMPMDVLQKSRPKGIAVYVKEENPYESRYIGEDN